MKSNIRYAVVNSTGTIYKIWDEAVEGWADAIYEVKSNADRCASLIAKLNKQQARVMKVEILTDKR